MILDLEQTYYDVDNEINGIDKAELKSMLKLIRFKSGESKLSISEYIVLMILYHLGHSKNLKAFWYTQKFLPHFKMPSYNVFLTWVNRLEGLLVKLLSERLIKLTSLGMVDSTKIETCKSHYRGKTHRAATVGYTSTGKFFGFKLHLVIDDKKRIVSYSITDAKTHDLKPIKEGLLEGQEGIILADSGYVGREIYHELMAKNLTLVAKPKQSMLENIELGLGYLDWDRYKHLYGKRFKIERLFDFLKNKLSLNPSSYHSTKGLFTHIHSVLLTYQMLVLNQLKFFTI